MINEITSGMVLREERQKKKIKDEIRKDDSLLKEYNYKIENKRGY